MIDAPLECYVNLNRSLVRVIIAKSVPLLEEYNLRFLQLRCSVKSYITHGLNGLLTLSSDIATVDTRANILHDFRSRTAIDEDTT